MMKTLLALYILATLDAMFSGICAASGRNALINKRRYFLNAMWHGVVWGQLAVLFGLAILAAIVFSTSNREEIVQAMLAMGNRMVLVYGIYGAIVLTTFLVRALPSVDVRSVTSTIGFGPLTVIRPAIILWGLAWGLMLHPSVPLMIAAIAIAGIMTPFRIMLNVWFSRQDPYLEFRLQAHGH